MTVDKTTVVMTVQWGQLRLAFHFDTMPTAGGHDPYVAVELSGTSGHHGSHPVVLKDLVALGAAAEGVLRIGS